MSNEEFIIKFYSCDNKEQFLKDLYHDLNYLRQKNEQLKIQISAREEKYRKLENNWNEVKKWSEKRIENANKYLNNPTKYWDEDSRGYVLARKFQLEELLKTMQELEKGKSE